MDAIQAFSSGMSQKYSGTLPNGKVTEKHRGVAVRSRSEEKEANAYVADGIQDEILTRLSKISDLKVISGHRLRHYKSAPENLPEIARIGSASPTFSKVPSKKR